MRWFLSAILHDGTYNKRIGLKNNDIISSDERLLSKALSHKSGGDEMNGADNVM
jgi:hypothetical protein